MKKGFTIIELLGIVVIVGVISIVSFVSIINAVERNEVREYENFENSLIDAASLYLSDNSDKFEKLEDSSESMFIDIEELIDAGFVGKIKSPTKTETYDYYIEVKKNYYNELEYKLVTEKIDYYREEILNGANPLIIDGMIPVTIENDGTVHIANRGEEWYKYEDQKWANMVLVTDETRDKYLGAKENSEVIKSDILGYYVWIPRYKYKIPTGGTSTPSTIDIVFEDKETPKSKGNATTEYFTHPGFTFGSDELNGIWVGKFEITGTKENPTVLPNLDPIRNANIGEYHNCIKLINNYGINRDPHVIKNVEWGAITYLSHSDYGINGNVEENTYWTTGCGLEDDTTDEDCDNMYGGNFDTYPQATTGNITGIFDMVGGNWEFTMGNADNILKSDISGFYKFPESRYLDYYHYSNASVSCENNCLGQSIYEVSGWYNSGTSYPSDSAPWTMRGKIDFFSISGTSGWDGYSSRMVIN